MKGAVVKFPTAYRPDGKAEIADGMELYWYRTGDDLHIGINADICIWREKVNLNTGTSCADEIIKALSWRLHHRRWWHHLMFWRRP